MNGWLTEKKAASSELLRLVGTRLWCVPGLGERAAGNQAVALPVSALLAAVDRVAQGQPWMPGG